MSFGPRRSQSPRSCLWSPFQTSSSAYGLSGTEKVLGFGSGSCICYSCFLGIVVVLMGLCPLHCQSCIPCATGSFFAALSGETGRRGSDRRLTHCRWAGNSIKRYLIFDFLSCFLAQGGFLEISWSYLILDLNYCLYLLTISSYFTIRCLFLGSKHWAQLLVTTTGDLLTGVWIFASAESGWSLWRLRLIRKYYFYSWINSLYIFLFVSLGLVLSLFF